MNLRPFRLTSLPSTLPHTFQAYGQNGLFPPVEFVEEVLLPSLLQRDMHFKPAADSPGWDMKVWMYGTQKCGCVGDESVDVWDMKVWMAGELFILSINGSCPALGFTLSYRRTLCTVRRVPLARLMAVGLPAY